jgi:ABC-type phosphate transport system substrate-binding protein
MYRLWIIGCLVLMASPFCVARDLAIIVNPANAAADVTQAELYKLMTLSTRQWADGKRVMIVIGDPASPDMRILLQKLYKTDSEDIKSIVDAHKEDILIAGSDEKVVKMVASNPTAIGVINVYSIRSEVKVLRIDRKLPLEAGYALHGN